MATTRIPLIVNPGAAQIQELAIGDILDINGGNIVNVVSITTTSVTASGNISADYFIGDGSLLTNLPAGNYSNSNVASFLPTYSGNVSANYFIGDGSLLTNLPAGNYSNANVAAFLPTYNGNITANNASFGIITSNLIPDGNNVYSLGNATNQWKDLWVSNATIYIDGLPLSVNVDQVLTFNGNALLTSLPNGEVAANSVVVSGNITSNSLNVGNNTTPGQYYISADANSVSLGEVAAQGLFISSTGTELYGTGGVTVTGINGACVTLGSATGGNVNVVNPINLGPISNVHIDGGTNGYFLQTDGNGGLSWAPDTGIPGGSNTQIQFNANGVFGGSSDLTWDGSVLSANGNVSANYFIGDGSQLTGLPASYGNANVADYLPTYTGDISANTINATATINGTDAVIANTVTANLFIGTFQGNITGNLVVPGANTQVLYNNDGNASADIGFTYNAATKDLYVANNINASNVITNGNVTANYFIGDGSQLTGLPASYGNANVADYLPTYTGNLDSLGNATTTGNVTANYFFGDGSQLTGITVNYGNANVADFLPTYDGNLESLTGNVTTAANVTANYFIGDGSLLTGLPASYGNANVAAYLPTYTGDISANTINATATINGTDAVIANSVTANLFIGNFQGNITGNLVVPGANTQVLFNNNGNADADIGFTYDAATKDLHVANTITTANVVASGNVTANYFIGDGSQLTGLPASYGNANVADYLPTYNGNLGNVGIANTLGVLMGTPSQGNLVSNAVSLTTSTALTDSIALLNTVLGKLVPPSPPTFPASQTLSISGMSTYRMANITQVNNTANSYTVAPGATVTNILRSASYSTNTITTVGPGDQGTVTAHLNGNVAGSVTLTGNSNGTYSNLVISANQDYHISNASIPAGFWYVFSSQQTGTAPAGWNDVVISDSAAGTTNVPSWYYDNSSPGTPAYTNATFAVGNAQVTYSSTVAHYNSGTQWNVGFTVGNVSGNTYPTSNTFVTGTTGGAFQAPVSVAYSQSSLASNIIPSFASANVTTTSNVVTGFGASASGPSVSVNNGYATGSRSFTPGATVNYKTGTTGSLTFLEETSLFVGGTIGSGVVGAVTRIANPGTGNTPTYTGTEAAFNSQTGPFYTYDAAVVANILSCNRTNYSTGYLPVGPDLSAQDTTQYFTFRFIAPSTSKFDIYYTGTLAGAYVALPGSGIDTSSTLNGWLDMSVAYSGAGQPGAGTGGNGSNGCALGTPVSLNTLQTARRNTCTFGTASTAGSTNNEVYVRIKLTTGQSITSLAIYPASN